MEYKSKPTEIVKEGELIDIDIPEPVAIVGMAIIFKRDGVYKVTVDRGRCTVTLENMVENAQWIPCSERLPEKSGSYLVTNNNWGEPVREVNVWYMTDCCWSRHHPIAWMPLPEPYQENIQD